MPSASTPTDPETRVSEAATLSHLPAEEIREHRRFFWITGIVSIVFGTIAILLPHIATLAANLTIGAIFAGTGLIEAVSAFQARRGRRIASRLLMGLLGLVAGLLLLFFPFSGILALTLLMSAYFLVSGGFKIYFAFKLRPAQRWGWVLAGGIASLLLGLILVIGMPGIALWALGLILGIDLVLYGFALIGLVRAAKQEAEQRQANRREEAPAT